MNTALSYYGAKELQALYPKFVSRSLAITITFHLLIIAGIYFSFSTVEKEIPKIKNPTIVEVYNPVVKEKIAPPKVQQISGKKIPSLANFVPVPITNISDEPTIEESTTSSIIGKSGDETGEIGSIGENSIGGIEIPKETEPAEFIPIEKLPVPIKQVAPTYPEIARRANIEGTVLLKIWVDKEGKVHEVRIVKSDSEIFNQAAIEAAKQYLFTPAIMNQNPVSVWVTIPFKFVLQSSR